jgi:spermidine/putrescine-binding protein
LDCWLVAYYVDYYIEQVVNNEGCFSELRKEKFPNNFQIAKSYSKYDTLSQPFLNKDNINIVAKKSPSFNLFLQQLQNILL